MSLQYKNKKLSHISQSIAQKEMDKLMPIIKDAQNLNQIDDFIDKTPASITKFTSKNCRNSLSYNIKSEEYIRDPKTLKNNFHNVIHKKLVSE